MPLLGPRRFAIDRYLYIAMLSIASPSHSHGFVTSAARYPVALTAPKHLGLPRQSSRAEIFNAGGNTENEKNYGEDPNEAHPQHHSGRHIGYLHHVRTPGSSSRLLLRAADETS
jgi:hypothetical protein